MAKKTTAPAAAEVPAVSEQPYYLQRAHIKDFRSIRDAKVEFKPGLNIIIGPNGSGKTNFINATRNLAIGNYRFSGSESSLAFNGPNLLEFDVQRSNKLNISESTNLSFLLDPNSVTASLKIDGKIYQKDKQVIDWLDVSIIRASKQLSFVMAPYVMVIGYDIPKEYPLMTSSFDMTIDEYAMIKPSINNQFCRVIINGIYSTISLANKYGGIGDNDLMNASAIDDVIKKVFSYVIGRVKSALEKYTLIKDLRLVESVRTYANSAKQEILIKGLALEFFTNEEWIPFDSLSSGTQRLFYIVTECLAPQAYALSAHFKKGHIVDESGQTILLEEPELGIHPDQLHKLLQFLREQSEKHQLIITTHSPQVLDMLKEDELDRITICELDEKKGTQFRKLKKAQIATAKKYMKEVGFLSDYWRHGSLEEKN